MKTRKNRMKKRTLFTLGGLNDRTKLVQNRQPEKGNRNEPPETAYQLIGKAASSLRTTGLQLPGRNETKPGPARSPIPRALCCVIERTCISWVSRAVDLAKQIFPNATQLSGFLYFYAFSSIMRKARTLSILLVFVFFASRSMAQVSLFAGPQITTAKYHIRNAKQEKEFKQGYMAGLRLTTSVEGPLYFAPALYYSRKGYKVSFNRRAALPDTAAVNNSTSYNTIAFTPLLQFNLTGARTHYFVRFGPGIDVAFSGKETFDSATGKQVSRPMTFGSLGYSPATAFATIQVGFVHSSGFSVYVNYEHGLSNFNNVDLGPMILQRVVGISVEWKLGRK